MPRYNASVELKAFAGIDQSVGAHNLNFNYAYNAKNCDTGYGELAPSPGYTAVYPSLPAPIVTLCSFYRRNHAVEAERSVLVAATANALYCILENGSVWKELMTGLESGEWSFVTYETKRDNDTPSDETDDYITDVLILSNAVDGVVVVYGDDLTAEAKADVPKFAVLERHAERIWGTGIDGEPDNLYYSQPFNPFEWGYVYADDGVTELPEQSGGVIQMPTWDGDKFVALKRFANTMLAFKANSAWYVRGVTAGEFAVVEAYGSDGVFAPATIVTDNARAYYVASGGMGVYDGDTATLLDIDRLPAVFQNMCAAAPQTACAIVAKHIIYVALPVYADSARTEQTRNNAIVEYDTRRGLYMIRTGIQADAIYRHNGRVLFTSGSNPYQVFEMTGTTYNGAAIPVAWMSGWQDLGAKNTVKSAFVVRITGFDTDATAGQSVILSIETEKGKKSKTITVVPGYKKTQFNFNGSGRRFRFIIEADSTVSWRLSGGVQIDMDIDED